MSPRTDPAGGPKTVADAAPATESVPGLNQEAIATVRRHVDVLRRAGLARAGGDVSVTPEELREAAAWVVSLLAPSGKLGLLSPREREVFDRVVVGGTNAGIAKALGISAKTIEAHRNGINRKLGAHSTADLVRAVVATLSVGGV